MQENPNKKNKLIGQMLVERGIITATQLDQALESQKNNRDYLCLTIIKLGFANAYDVFKTLAEYLNIEYVDIKHEKIDPQAVEKVPVKMALHYKLMPYLLKGHTLKVALSDPFDIHKLDDLKLLLNINIEPVLSYEGDIIEAIQNYYGVGADIIEDMMTKEEFKDEIRVEKNVVEDIEAAVEDASIIKFVNQLFGQAVEERATDIHLEPFENELRVRFRIDGFLYEVPIPESIKLFHAAIISRIKIMAHLDIAEHRLPQDGRIKIKIKNHEQDLRISIIPSAFGEALQIRILTTTSFVGLKHIGLFEADAQKLQLLLNKPYGIIFVTGPTGSGKSTTLYACLNEKNLPNVKIITTEDPIEYQMRGVVQMQINPKIGFSFAEGLRSILRHDPDIIMVGEVRDSETAEITIRSAMTGHLVFSTLHTNDAASSPTRLIDMGIEPFLVASSLEGIIAQRLVRVICPKCKKAVPMSSEIFRKEGLEVKEDKVTLFEGAGCQFCRFTGYKGRTAIFEILLVTETIRELIFKRVTSQVIKEKALAEGMNTLRQDGLRKALSGVTTLSEVMRVT